MASSSRAPRRIVVLGYPGVGKTSITTSFNGTRDFAQGYEPTIGHVLWRKVLEFNGELYEVEVFDTAGMYENSSLDQKLLIAIDGFVLVYGVDDRRSFECACSISDRVLSHYGDSVPLVLVGNKSDRRDRRQVSLQDGETEAKRIGGVHVECSALANENIDQVFESMMQRISIARGESPTEKRKCAVM